jgi:hypothetical protein
MHAGLVLLSFRRALHPGVWLPSLALLAFAATREHAPDVAAAFRRQELWLVPSLFVLPLLVRRAAGIVPRWRAADADWRATRGASRAVHLASAWFGTWLAGAALLVATAAVAGGWHDERALRWSRAVAHPAASLVTDEPVRVPLDLTLDETTEHVHLQLHPSVAPGRGPAAQVELRLVTGDGADEVEHAQSVGTVHGRGELRIALAAPAGNGRGELPLTAVLRRVGGSGYVVFPADSSELLDGFRGVTFLAGPMLPRALALLAAALALAIGLGAWMRPGLAAGCVLCVWLVPFAWRVGHGVLPGGDLVRSLAHLGDHLAPPPVPALSWLGALVLVALGLGLARRGLRSWRSPA